jgi:hypothetical protein
MRHPRSGYRVLDNRGVFAPENLKFEHIDGGKLLRCNNFCLWPKPPVLGGAAIWPLSV